MCRFATLGILDVREPLPRPAAVYGIVYKATLRSSGEFYVGCTTTPLHERARHHASAARNEATGCSFHAAIREHGKFAFAFEVLQHCFSKGELLACEDRWLGFLSDNFPGCFNERKFGGDGAHFMADDPGGGWDAEGAF